MDVIIEAVIVWLIIAVVAAGAEVLTGGLFLATIAVAAGLTSITSVALPAYLQVVIFAMFSLLGLAVFRPIVIQMIGYEAGHDLAASPNAHLIGRRAVVVDAVKPGGGQIRIGQGEFWTARPYDGETVIEPGEPVDILLIDGLTALVAPAVPALEADTAQPKGITAS
ncbi:MAG: NfeD family protein [Chloroflexota bacterium]